MKKYIYKIGVKEYPFPGPEVVGRRVAGYRPVRSIFLYPPYRRAEARHETLVGYIWINVAQEIEIEREAVGYKKIDPRKFEFKGRKYGELYKFVPLQDYRGDLPARGDRSLSKLIDELSPRD